MIKIAEEIDLIAELLSDEFFIDIDEDDGIEDHEVSTPVNSNSIAR